VSALFRDEVAPERHWPRWIYIALTIAAVALLAVLAVKLAYDQRIATIFVVAAAAVFLSLRLVASGLMAIAKRMPRRARPRCGWRSPTSTVRARSRRAW
jgi:putative ABC transport system permease protein